MKKAVFLDRDGVIIEDTNLLYKKEEVIILSNVERVLSELKKRDYLLIIITNQPTVARGLITERGVEDLNSYINLKIGNLIDGFYFCPHHPNADLLKYRKNCNCRKPSSGLILKASKDFEVNLIQSWMIGDMNSDIIAGKNAGCRTILIKSLKNKEKIEVGKKLEIQEPDYKIKNILEVLEIIK